MTFEPTSTQAVRPSDEERDRVIAVLRESVAVGRLSHDTFVRRTELALIARSRAELESLTDDLPGNDRVSLLLMRAMNALGLRTRNWPSRDKPIPVLMLPQFGHDTITIGRDRTCDLRLSDQTVSRSHAELRRAEAGWTLRDFGSMNGTFVNGRRVAGVASVRPGDQIRFGRLVYRLTAH